MALQLVTDRRDIHPVDIFEHVAALREWDFERASDDEINLTVTGIWTDYHLSLAWMEEFEALHLAAAFDFKVPEKQMAETSRLLMLINEQLLFGHFDIWAKEGSIMFRQALMLNGGAEPTSEQLDCLVSNAVEACERYFQAFQFVVWAGQGADEALQNTLFETQGNA